MKLITEEAVKCVYPFTGDFDVNGGAGGACSGRSPRRRRREAEVATAQPVSEMLGVGEPGAESVTVNVPGRVVLGRTELGVKVTKTRQEELAAMGMVPVPQLLVAEKSPVVPSEKVSDSVS